MTFLGLPVINISSTTQFHCSLINSLMTKKNIYLMIASKSFLDNQIENNMNVSFKKFELRYA